MNDDNIDLYLESLDEDFLGEEYLSNPLSIETLFHQLHKNAADGKDVSGQIRTLKLAIAAAHLKARMKGDHAAMNKARDEQQRLANIEDTMHRTSFRHAVAHA